jgi:ubiquinone biosynthesis protein COQ4
MSSAAAEISSYSNPDGVVPTKRSWRTVFGCWRGFIFPSRGLYNGEIYRAYLALGGPIYACIFYRTRAHPNGRKLIRDKPDIFKVLRDDDYLASLPPGTLGHAYRSFLTTNRLDAAVIDEATVIRPLAEQQNWDEDFYYLMLRWTSVHDIFHVIGGYGPDMAGEVTNIGFHCGQMESPGPMKKFGYIQACAIPGAPLRHKLRVFRQAIERGRRADNMWAAPWEELFDKPIDEVRELLGIAPKHAAHPDGGWFTTWTPIGMKAPTRWDYDEILAREHVS